MMKARKNTGRLFALAALFTLMLSQPVVAETSGKITADSVKIRSSADSSSTVVGSTEKGKTVSITGKTTDANGTTWYQVYVDENVLGYIRADLLEASGESSIPDVKSGSTDSQTSTTASNSVQASVMATSGTGMVTPPSTNIRNAAVTGDVVCTLQSGAMVTITGETTGSDSKKWYQVSFIKDSKSYTGFIRADLVDTTKTAEDAQTAQQSDASTTQNDEAGTQSDESVAQPSDVEIIVPDNVSLKSLTISSGTITPEFSSNVTNYTIQAEESTMEIAISAVVTDSDSQITSADGFKDLQPGLNAASIVVTAADGTSQTYSFSIICGEVTAVPDEEETEEEESIEVEGAMEEVAESAEDTVDIEEYNKYKDLATKRLMIMCVLGFLLAVALVVIINLLLKIHDMNDDDDEEDEEEEEKPAPKKKKAALEKKPQKKSLFEKREYKKLDADEAKPLKTTLSQKEQVERSKQKPQKSVMMPDLREEAKAEELYESDEAYDDTGLDDDFEFEFINLDSKR